MRIHNETAYRVGHAPAMYSPAKPFMTVIVKGMFTLVENGPCVALPPARQSRIGSAQYFMDEHGNSLKYPTDAVPYKARADCLFIGSAHVPDGGSADQLDVTFAVGAMRKTLTVFGPRQWVRAEDGSAHLTQPGQFTSLPVRAEYAHGGVRSAYNRHGIGFEPLATAPGSKVVVANVQPAGGTARSWDHDGPWAGFGPLQPLLLPRRKLLGTTDEKWQVRRRPLPPEDFDVAFFNTAPADQQVDGYLVGDEEIFLENLHPTSPQFHARLPGTLVRCFVCWRDDGAAEYPHEFAEVMTSLDTCIVNVPEGVVTLIWRGTLEIESRQDTHIEHLLVVEEPLDAARPPQSYADLLFARLDKGRTDAAAAAEEARRQQVATIHRDVLAAAVRALEEAGAAPELIASMKQQTSIEGAQQLIAEQVEALSARLPGTGG